MLKCQKPENIQLSVNFAASCKISPRFEAVSRAHCFWAFREIFIALSKSFFVVPVNSPITFEFYFFSTWIIQIICIIYSSSEMAKKLNLKLTSPFAGLKILVAWPLPAIFVPFTKFKGPFNRFDTFVGIISQIDKNLKFIFTQKSLSRSLLLKLSSYFAWRIDGQYWPWITETNTKIHARNHSLPGFVIFHNLLKNWKFFTFRHNFFLRF